MTVKNNRNLVIGIALLIIGVIGLGTLPGMGMTMGGMMGPLLPPGIHPENLPDPQSAGAQLFVQYCTQCHELPGPGMHTAQQWPLVVDRMNQRMRMMSDRGMMGMMHDIKAPSDNELHTLALYLQTHAK